LAILDFVLYYPGEPTPERYHQEGKTNLDLLSSTRARDSEWQWHQLGHMQICTLTKTHNHSSIHHSVFTGWMPFLPSNQQRQSTEGIVVKLADIEI